MKTVGITGGIGSGKTTAARILGELGAHVIDADTVGHDLYRPGSAAWQPVVDCFGRTVVADDGTIDRRRLGAIVFADPAQLNCLNAIMHPLMREEIGRRIATHRAAGAREPIVLEAAVLIEANWLSLVEELWLVVARPEVVVERVAAQRGIDRAAIAVRIQAQLTDAERRSHATVVIDNSGSVDDLRAEVQRLWRDRLAAAR